MRVLLFNLLIATTIYAKSFGVVVIDNKQLHIDESLKSQIEALFEMQKRDYVGKNTIDIFIDREKKIKKMYTRYGTRRLIEYAQSKHYDSIALVAYKKSSRFLSIMVLVTNKNIQDKKSKLIAFHPTLTYELPKTIFNGVLSLNYELGVLHVTTRY